MSKGEQKLWTRDELILAINLYCKTPFGKIDRKNPEIIALANLIGRTPNSVSYKLANFASIDPSLDRKGAMNVSHLDRKVWAEFFNNWDEMAFESEKMLAKMRGDEIIEDRIDEIEGKTRLAQVKIRVNQNFFRKMILTSYKETCCITGLRVKELLVASHIKPWSIDEKNRINPRNGLCLNALHDKAFDVGLITFDDQFKVVVSNQVLKDKENTIMLNKFHGVTIQMPNRFIPDQQFLDYHRNNIYRDS